MNRTVWLKRLVFGATLASASVSVAAAQELNLYTTREPGLMKPLIDGFTKTTGTKVNVVFLKDGIAERIAAEGTRSPADVLMTVDIGNLIDLVERGLTQPVNSTSLNENIPANLRGAKGEWFALSLRARTVYATKELKLSQINYEQLADPAWKGKICIRSAQHPYNVALIASYIAHYDTAAAEKWLAGVKANLARKPGGGDREVARDILGGLCDIGIGNSYYVGVMKSGRGGPEQQKWVNAIKMILPTFKDGGTQVNVSGAGIARNAPNRATAVRFLEYLAAPAAQKIYAEANYEYPVNPKAAVDPLIAEYGVLRPDRIDLVKVAQQRRAASALAEKVGFDQ